MRILQDFAVMNWTVTQQWPSSDPACAKGRMVFLITLSDCSMVWVSKLQTETALFALEAEIISFALSCCELFPVVDFVVEIGKAIGLPTEDWSQCTFLCMRTMRAHLFWHKPFLLNLHLGANTTQLRQCGFVRRSTIMKSNWWRLIPWSNWGIFSQKDCQELLLSISKRWWWDDDCFSLQYIFDRKSWHLPSPVDCGFHMVPVSYVLCMVQ